MLPNEFGHLKLNTVIYKEEQLVCFQVVYTSLIVSMEMQNWTAIDRNTISSWQKDKGKKRRKNDVKERGEKSFRTAGAGSNKLVFRMAVSLSGSGVSWN